MNVDRDRTEQQQQSYLHDLEAAHDFEEFKHAFLVSIRNMGPVLFCVSGSASRTETSTPSVPPALGAAALRALASEQPRELTPDEVHRLMTPLPSDDGGWEEELAEDRRSTTTDDPWPGQ